MKNFRTILLAAGFVGLLGSIAIGQPVPVPQVQSIGPSDLFQDIVNGTPQAQSYYASSALLGNYTATQPGNNPTNDLIAGDFGFNLFQDGTSTANVTTSATYVADQWAAFSGTSTNLTGAQQTGASDIFAGYGASLRITRTGSGILQSCVAQIIASNNVLRYQGATAEVDFHALAGSGFSAVNSVVNVLVVTGTGTNDTMANLAKTVNSALSGTAWAGAATTTVAVPITTVWTRYTVVAPVPAAATELGVVFCWTPVGASPSNDYWEFTGAQLTPNSSLTAVAGTGGAVLNPNDLRAKSFFRRPQSLETNLQLAFYWRQNESTANIYGVCQETSSTNAFCFMTFPVPMYAVPTISYTQGGISATLGTSQAAVAITALTITTSGATKYGSQLTATAASGLTALTGFLEGTTTTGKVAFSARF